ncbi:MAG: hypothetical protein VX113_09405, partial [Pseudomonadota bacterium]|nr:hypothetical protein [Pseudomonadota bacterium]
ADADGAVPLPVTAIAARFEELRRLAELEAGPAAEPSETPATDETWFDAPNDPLAGIDLSAGFGDRIHNDPADDATSAASGAASDDVDGDGGGRAARGGLAAPRAALPPPAPAPPSAASAYAPRIAPTSVGRQSSASLLATHDGCAGAGMPRASINRATDSRRGSGAPSASAFRPSRDEYDASAATAARTPSSP